MDKHTKKLVGLGVLLVGGYLLYNYSQNQNKKSVAAPAPLSGVRQSEVMQNMAGMAGMSGSKSLSGFKGLDGFKSLTGFEKGFAGVNSQVQDAKFAKASGNASLPAGKFFDVADKGWVRS
jgi:hypothetical protein